MLNVLKAGNRMKGKSGKNNIAYFSVSGNVEKSEGNAGEVKFSWPVTVNAGLERDVAVGVRVVPYGPAAALPSQFRMGQFPDWTLRFPVGTTTMQFNAYVVGNTTVDVDRTFMVELYPIEPLSKIVQGTAYGKIRNDDSILLPTINDDTATTYGTNAVFVDPVANDNLLGNEVALRVRTNGTASFGSSCRAEGWPGQVDVLTDGKVRYVADTNPTAKFIAQFQYEAYAGAPPGVVRIEVNPVGESALTLYSRTLPTAVKGWERTARLQALGMKQNILDGMKDNYKADLATVRDIYRYRWRHLTLQDGGRPTSDIVGPPGQETLGLKLPNYTAGALPTSPTGQSKILQNVIWEDGAYCHTLEGYNDREGRYVVHDLVPRAEQLDKLQGVLFRFGWFRTNSWTDRGRYVTLMLGNGVSEGDQFYQDDDGYGTAGCAVDIAHPKTGEIGATLKYYNDKVVAASGTGESLISSGFSPANSQWNVVDVYFKWTSATGATGSITVYVNGVARITKAGINLARRGSGPDYTESGGDMAQAFGASLIFKMDDSLIGANPIAKLSEWFDCLEVFVDRASVVPPTSWVELPAFRADSAVTWQANYNTIRSGAAGAPTISQQPGGFRHVCDVAGVTPDDAKTNPHKVNIATISKAMMPKGDKRIEFKYTSRVKPTLTNDNGAFEILGLVYGIGSALFPANVSTWNSPSGGFINAVPSDSYFSAGAKGFRGSFDTLNTILTNASDDFRWREVPVVNVDSNFLAKAKDDFNVDYPFDTGVQWQVTVTIVGNTATVRAETAGSAAPQMTYQQARDKMRDMLIPEHKANYSPGYKSSAYPNYTTTVYEAQYGGDVLWRHTGEDVAAVVGKATKCVVAGKIVDIDNSGDGYTHRIVVYDAVNKLYWLYGHLNADSGLTVNQNVAVGDTLGTVADSTRAGWSPHCHFGVSKLDWSKDNTTAWKSTPQYKETGWGIARGETAALADQHADAYFWDPVAKLREIWAPAPVQPKVCEITFTDTRLSLEACNLYFLTNYTEAQFDDIHVWVKQGNDGPVDPGTPPWWTQEQPDRVNPSQFTDMAPVANKDQLLARINSVDPLAWARIPVTGEISGTYTISKKMADSGQLLIDLQDNVHSSYCYHDGAAGITLWNGKHTGTVNIEKGSDRCRYSDLDLLDYPIFSWDGKTADDFFGNQMWDRMTVDRPNDVESRFMHIASSPRAFVNNKCKNFTVYKVYWNRGALNYGRGLTIGSSEETNGWLANFKVIKCLYSARCLYKFQIHFKMGDCWLIQSVLEAPSGDMRDQRYYWRHGVDGKAIGNRLNNASLHITDYDPLVAQTVGTGAILVYRGDFDTWKKGSIPVTTGGFPQCIRGIFAENQVPIEYGHGWDSYNKSPQDCVLYNHKSTIAKSTQNSPPAGTIGPLPQDLGPAPASVSAYYRTPVGVLVAGVGKDVGRGAK